MADLVGSLNIHSNLLLEAGTEPQITFPSLLTLSARSCKWLRLCLSDIHVGCGLPMLLHEQREVVEEACIWLPGVLAGKTIHSLTKAAAPFVTSFCNIVGGIDVGSFS